MHISNNLVLEEYIGETKKKRTKYNILNDSEDDVEEDLFDEDFYLKSVERMFLKKTIKQVNRTSETWLAAYLLDGRCAPVGGGVTKIVLTTQ